MSRNKNTPKTGGRVKGTPNKVTTDLRVWINDLLYANRMQISNDIQMLEPYQRVIIFEKLLSYAVPKMQSVEAKVDLNSLSDEQLEILINEMTKDL